MTDTTLTGSYIAIAGVIVSILAHFNIVVTQDGIVAILAGVAALYGVVHQIVQNKVAIAASRRP
jgi:hypothetical protein